MAGCKEDGKENDWGDRTAEVMSSHDRRERSKGSEVDSVSEKSASELQTCSVWAGHTEGSCWQPLSSQLGNRVAKGVPSMGKAGRGNPQTSQLWNKEHLKFPWVWRLKDGNVSVKQMWWIYIHNGISLSLKNESPAICDNANEPWGHYVKWNKSEKDKYYLTSLKRGT